MPWWLCGEEILPLRHKDTKKKTFLVLACPDYEIDKNNNNYMKVLIRFLSLILISITFTSCSLLLGGMVALDNHVSKGEKEIKYEEIIKLNRGKRIILELTDSTIVSGIYKGFKEIDEGNKHVTIITILDKNNVVEFINNSKVNKYIYVDEGGSVWTAIAIGVVVDALLIYAFIKGPSIGGTARIF